MNRLCHLPRSLHHQDRPTLEATGTAKKEPPKDHMAADSGEGKKADLEQHSSHGKGPADMEG